MTSQQIALIAAAALLLFWALGAYNRLVALRNRIGAAFTQVDEALQRRAAALTALARGLGAQDKDALALLDAAQAANPPLRTAADALRVRPVQADRTAALATAETSAAQALALVLAWLEQHPGAAASGDVAPALATLHDALQRLAFARQLFNDAVGQYNAAARQRPTRWLARLFGFAAAGNL